MRIMSLCLSLLLMGCLPMEKSPGNFNPLIADPANMAVIVEQPMAAELKSYASFTLVGKASEQTVSETFELVPQAVDLGAVTERLVFALSPGDIARFADLQQRLLAWESQAAIGPDGSFSVIAGACGRA